MKGAIARAALVGIMISTGLATTANPHVVAGPSLHARITSMKGVQSPQPIVYRVSKGQKFSVYLTGYSFWDNTPPGSAAIARPVIRQQAGGSGTYSDPITIAVGHRIDGGRQELDFPAGTRFYFPALRRYAIVEDVCGDGPTPQYSGCHRGYNGLPWLDIYVDGSGAGRHAATACAINITGVHEVIVAPPRGLPVVQGALTESGCRT